MITLKSRVTSVTIKTKKGLISETAALIKQIKKHKTKKLTFTRARRQHIAEGEGQGLIVDSAIV